MNSSTYFLYGVVWVLAVVPIAWTLTSVTSPTTDTVLSVNDSPYHAAEDIIVPEGVTLSIEAGVILQFSPNRQLIVEGALHIDGTDDAFASLTVFSTTDSSELNQTIRLDGGSNDNNGILQVLGEDGSWKTVYDSRTRYPGNNKEWTTGLSQVVCRQLGFPVDYRAGLYNDGSHYIDVTQTVYDCTGNEPTFDNCTKSMKYTTYGYKVGVKCNSPNGHYWGGIDFIGNTSSSVLKNVILEYPGIKLDQDGYKVYTAGIITSGKVKPIMHEVYVNNSGYDGFQLAILGDSRVLSHLYADISWHTGFRLTIQSKDVVLSNVQASGCHQNGIDITSSLSNERLELSDVEVLENTGYGISMQTDHSNLDGIDSTNEYPKALHTKEWASQQTRVFSTAEGEILALYVLNVPRRSHLVIRDEENIASPVLYTGVYENYPPPIPWLVTTGRIMSIYINRVDRDFDDVVDMILYAGPPGSFGWHLNNIDMLGNGDAGVQFRTTSMPQYLNEITANGNNAGIEMNNVRSYTYISRSTISNNSNYGINVNSISGQINITQCSLNFNMKAVKASYSSYQFYDIHPQSISAAIDMRDSFVNDNQLGFDLLTYISSDFIFRNVTFARNTKLINHRSYYVGHWSTFGLHDSFIYSNKGEIELYYQSGSHLAITKSQFTQNENQLLYATDSYNRFSNRWIINGNNFTENSGSEYIIKLDWRYEKVEQVNITENRFENNILEQYKCGQKRELRHKTGILHCNIKQNISFHENIFINSNSKYDLYTVTPNHPKYSINASHCYWGTHDQFLVPQRIYGSQFNRNLFDVNIYPYYDTPDRNDVSERDPIASLIYQNTIGGVLDTYVSLTDTSVTYKVIRNIQIVRGGHLHIGAGINIAFDIGLGIQVDEIGTLDLEGQYDSKIYMYAFNTYDCDGVRLTDSNNNTTNTGIVQMKTHDTLHPICYRNFDTSTLTFLCQFIGFDGYESQARELSSLNGLNLERCAGDSLPECTFTTRTATNCTNGVLYIECTKPTWEGVWFSLRSKRSNIRHVTLSQAGYTYDDARSHTDGSALYFEFHHHTVHDIEIINNDNKAKAGIIVIYNTLRQTMNDILIEVNSYMDGFVISDNAVVLNNLKINCVQHTNCGDKAIEIGAYSSPNIHGIPFYSINYHHVNPEQKLVLKLPFRSMERYTDYLTNVEVDVGYSFYIKEMYRATIDCDDQLQVYEGDLNSATLAHVRFHKKTSTYTWWTDGNKVSLLFSYTASNTKYCTEVSLLIVPFPNWLAIDEPLLDLKNATIDGFNTGVYITNVDLEVKLNNTSFTDVRTGINGYDAGHCVVHILNISAVHVQKFLRFQETSGSITIYDSSFFDTSYVFYGDITYINNLGIHASEFDGISGAVIWTDLYYDTFDIIDFMDNTINNATRALDFYRSYPNIIPNNVTISQNQFENCVYGVASICGDFVVFSNNTIRWNNLSSDNSLVSMAGGFSNIAIQYNVFEDNSYSGYILHLNVQSYSSDSTASVLHNIFRDNTGISDAPLLYAGAFSSASVRYNIFEGYGNCSLLRSPIISLNPQFILDFSHNYWSLFTQPEILQRIHCQDNHIQLLVAPFYSDSKLQNIISPDPTNRPIGNNMTSASNKIGRMDSNKTFSSNTEITFEGQTIITPSVEVKVEEGVVLYLKEHTNLLVYGTIRLAGKSDNPVFIHCPHGNCRIHLYSNKDQISSLFDHVELYGVSILQISGKLPILKNVVMKNSENGIVILGNEAYQQTELEASDIQILNSSGNAFTHFDVRYDISMSSISINDVIGKGIAIQPILDGGELMFGGNPLLSTFSFCDADRTIKLLPKESLRYFNTDRTVRNCIRVVETEPGYIISTTILTRYFNRQYDNELIADVFDGPVINESRKLIQIYDVTNARKLITLRSTRPSIVVRLMAMEKDIDYVVFHSTPVKERDCTFESECEKWQIRNNQYSSGLTRWQIYSWNEDDNYGDVIQNDINLPFSTDGHYLVLRGHPTWSESNCNNNYYGSHLTEMNILESSVISPSEHLCSVSFSYFARGRSVNLLYGQTLRFQVYQTSATLNVLLRDLSNSFSNGWSYVSIPLSSQLEDNFTIVLLADTYTDCKMSLGVDNIEFKSCSEESDLGITRITNSVVTKTGGQAITISNPDQNKHSLIWLENIDIGQSGLNSAPVVDILLKSGQVLVRNNDISNNKGKAIRIQFTSANIDQKSEATITQNNLVNCSSAIHVANTGINDAILTFTQNTVQNMKGDDSSSVFEVINARIHAIDNVFHNNTCRHVLDLGTEEQMNTITLPLIFKRNVIWYNTFLNPERKYSVLANAIDVIFTNNVINNPVSQYEVSTSVLKISNATLNFTSNWWGSGVEALASKKIQDGRVIFNLAYVDFMPILSAPPEFLGLQRSLCPFGWTEINSVCCIYKRESRSYFKAEMSCRNEGSSLISGNDIDVDFMATRTLYVDLNELKQYSSVWARSTQTAGTNSEMCYKFTIDGGSLTIIKEESDCLDKHPFICKREPVVRCPNRCFGHGSCSYRTCNCYNGWEGEDCSDFHCRDVSNCHGKGSCVGPNQCSCHPGWSGRGCSTSICPSYDSCQFCSQHEGCGWCDESSRCEPGTGHGSAASSCTAWFYYDCITPDWSTSCSSEIAGFSCKRFCDVAGSEYNVGFCQRCMDTENCYRNVTCSSWNEDNCPLGVPNPDYDDERRREQVELFENVKLISRGSRVLYTCPYNSFSDDPSRNELLLIAESGELYGSGTILVSDQSGGIFHKILKEADTEGFSLWVATRAKLEEVFKYADFQYSVDLSASPVDPFEELLPEQNLLNDITSGKVSLKQTVHDLSSNIVYKCIGSVYKGASDTYLTTSQYITLPENIGSTIEVGNVIVSKSSHGFMEHVDRISRNSFGVFAFTTLTQCSDNSLPNSLNTVVTTDMSCIGDSPMGFEYYTSGNTQSVSAGDTVIGRHSGGFLGLVLSKSEQGGFVYIEMIPIESIVNGTAVGEVDPSKLTTNKRRKRATFDKKIEFSDTLLESNGEFQSMLDITDLMLTVCVKFPSYTYDSFTIVIGGDITASLVADLSATVGMSKTGSLNALSKKPTKFYIPVLGVNVGGEVNIDLSGTWSMIFEAEGSIYANSTIPLNFFTGYATGPPSNSVFRNVEQMITGSINDKSAEASSTQRLNLQIQVQWPSTTLTFSSIRDDIPDDIKQQIDVEQVFEQNKQVGLNLDVTLKASFLVSGELSACSTECKDSTGTLFGELSTQVTLERSLQGFGVSNNVQLSPRAIPSKSDCLASNVLCCLCEHEDGSFYEGRINQTSNECLCNCTCDDGSTNLKKEGGECECDKCPDGSFKQTGMTFECPCECADESVKAMEPNGTCDCSCLCADGSTKDIISPTGDCPCECTCNNCDVSTGGKNACDCPDDVCSTCDNGMQAQWSNCRCDCPNACGKPPACASGRKGPNCDDPHCPGGCSGNGVCEKLSKCQSRCDCDPPWAGVQCESVDRDIWGDPHLITLDGVNFDYFGIGQFWDCKSEDNDFGIQVRYFYYKQTSLTGAVAVKAGVSVVTVTTDSYAVVGDLPTVRVDGMPVDYSSGSYSIRLSEGSTLVNIKKTDAAAAEDVTSVALVSFQFSTVLQTTGPALTADVRYSPKMNRQYINIQSSVTAAFKSKTSGLCGFLDGDITNDFTGIDGTIYDSTQTDAFVESWKIEPMNRIGGGLMNSWSWTQSNFHEGDLVDISYTNPNFVPSYSIDGFSTVEVDLATQTCEQLDIEDSILDGCIYDVLITNDTTMANQEALKTGCPNKCSGKGRCQNDTTCICIDGWSGPDCSTGSCGACYNGRCQSGLCRCNNGWEGEECTVEANCDSVDNCTSPNGECLRTDVCLCNDGFTGVKCDQIATCAEVNECSGNGVCIDFDVCRCDTGWSGTNCSVPACDNLNFCSANGICVEYDACACNAGWKGVSCSNPDCSTLGDCSVNGRCTEPNVCVCYNGFTGSACEQSLSCPALDDCSGNGVCSDNATTRVLSCRCYTGYSGANCSDVSCINVNNCNGNGKCSDPDVCACDFGYMGADCSALSCEGLSRCNGHGTCVSHEICDCNDGWDGNDCSEPKCKDVEDCSAQGTCIGPDECQCFDGYEGKNCSQQVGENEHAPVFTSSDYTSSIFGGALLPVTLVKLEATDEDVGRNGEMTYSIGASGISFDLAQHILIDSESGVITLVKHISATALPSGKLSIAATVTDSGSPSKSDATTIDLIIEFANENCPDIVSPRSGASVYINLPIAFNETIVQVEATDKDVGINGELVYSITGTDSDKFMIDKDTGIIMAQTDLTAGTYSFACVVSDTGDPPCKRSMSISAIATAASIPPQGTDTDPTTIVPEIETTAQSTVLITETVMTDATTPGIVDETTHLQESQELTVISSNKETTSSRTSTYESSTNTDVPTDEIVKQPSRMEPFVGSITMITMTTVLVFIIVVGGITTTVLCIKQRGTIRRLHKQLPMAATSPAPSQISHRFDRPPHMRFQWN